MMPGFRVTIAALALALVGMAAAQAIPAIEANGDDISVSILPTQPPQLARIPRNHAHFNAHFNFPIPKRLPSNVPGIQTDRRYHVLVSTCVLCAASGRE